MLIKGESTGNFTVIDRETDADNIRLFGERVTVLWNGAKYSVCKRWKSADEYAVSALDTNDKAVYSLCFCIKPYQAWYCVSHMVKITHPDYHRYEAERYLKKHYTEISAFANEIIGNGLLPYKGKRIHWKTVEIDLPQLSYLVWRLNDVNESLTKDVKPDMYERGMKRAYLDSVDHLVKKLRGEMAFVRKDEGGVYKTYERQYEWI